MKLKSHAKFEEKPTCGIVKTTWAIWHNFTRTLESVQIGTFMESFCPKHKMRELEIYRGVMCNGTKEWWKICRGNGLPF